MQVIFRSKRHRMQKKIQSPPSPADFFKNGTELFVVLDIQRHAKWRIDKIEQWLDMRA